MNSTEDTEAFPWATPATEPAKGRKPAAKSAPAIVLDLDTMPPGEGPALEGMPRADLPAIRAKIDEQIAELLVKADALTVTAIDDTEGMERAREYRLAIREVRLFTEKKHRELKAWHLEKGREVDQFKNQVLEICKAREERLLLLEEFAEHEKARIEGERRVSRLIELQPFLQDGQRPAVDLGTLEEAEWTGYLQDARDLHELRVARQKKEAEDREAARLAEEQRIAKERAEREAERQRIEEENRRLREEREAERKRHAEAEAARKAEWEAAEATRAAERAAAEAERKAAAAERAKQQAEIDRANAERDRLQQEADRKEAAARMEQARQEAEAAESARKAAAAPDKEKFEAFATHLDALKAPAVGDAGKDLAAALDKKLAWLANWLRTEAGNL